MDNLLGETITIFDKPVVRIINPFVVKWMVCNSKILFASVIHILQVTVKVFLLGSHRIGCQLSFRLRLSFNNLVTWGLLLKTSLAFLHDWVWSQLTQARCVLNLLLWLHRFDNRSKLDKLMLSVLCAGSLQMLAHFCLSQLALFDLNCLLFCFFTPLLCAAILNWVYDWIHDGVSHMVGANWLAFTTEVSHSFFVLLPCQWVKCCCFSINLNFLGFLCLIVTLFTLFNDFIFLLIATYSVVYSTHNLFCLLVRR